MTLNNLKHPSLKRHALHYCQKFGTTLSRFQGTFFGFKSTSHHDTMLLDPGGCHRSCMNNSASCFVRSYASHDKANSGASNLQYCIDLVRKCDYENYLGILLLPREAQRAAFALRAFNVELAQVGESVSEKNIGLMRMRFWTDALSKITEGMPPQAPVAVELSGAFGYYKLSKRWLQRILEARAQNLSSDFYSSMKAVEEYSEHVNSSLYYLVLECLGIKDVQADHAASHLGKAQGIVTILRSTPFHASNRRVYLPMDILAQHKVSHEDIIRGKTSQPVKDVVFDVASLAHQHLEKARSLNASLPAKSNLVFLNASICDHYLKSLQRVDFNVFDGKLQHKNALLAYHMYANKLRKKF